jgi:hypothetical protein
MFALFLLEHSLTSLLGEGPAGILFVVTIMGAVFGAGVTFAVCVGYSRSEHGLDRRYVIGAMFVGVAFLGLLVPMAFEPVGLRSGPLMTFRIAFVAASSAIAFVATAIASRLLGLRESLTTAAIVAAATGASYLLVALVVDPIPGWHVGGGDRAMVKVAALGNFTAGLIGGAVAHHLLSRATR